MLYYLALGSNLGDRHANITGAVGFLNTVGTVSAVSSIHETEPVGMAPGTGKFYNLAAALESKLSPLSLLKTLKNFEKSMGRDIDNSHFKSRTIDIDILLAEDRVINTETLTIPHKEMHTREFVLAPLSEIAPDVIHPVFNKTINQLLKPLMP